MDDGRVMVTKADAMRLLSWSITDLWLAFIAAGGARSLPDVEAHLYGRVELSIGQSDVVAAALNDALMERGELGRVAYHDDAGS